MNKHTLFAESHGETMVFPNPGSSSRGPHHHHEATGVGRPQLSPEPCENCKHTGRGQLSCSRLRVFRKPSPAAGPGRWPLARSSPFSCRPWPGCPGPMYHPCQTPCVKLGVYKQRNRIPNRLAHPPAHTGPSETRLESL